MNVRAHKLPPLYPTSPDAAARIAGRLVPTCERRARRAQSLTTPAALRSKKVQQSPANSSRCAARSQCPPGLGHNHCRHGDRARGEHRNAMRQKHDEQQNSSVRPVTRVAATATHTIRQAQAESGWGCGAGIPYEVATNVAEPKLAWKRMRGFANVEWSGRQDLNLRPPHPQCGALPDCATPRRTLRTRAKKARDYI